MSVILPEGLLNVLAEAVARERRIDGRPFSTTVEDAAAHTLEWLDADDNPVGEPVLLAVRAAPVEAFAIDGSIAFRNIPVPMTLAEPLSQAVTGRLLSGEGEIARFPRAALLDAADRMPEVAPRCHPTADSDLFFPVFAERFTDEALFNQRFDALDGFLRSIAPFNNSTIGTRLQLRGYFWPGCEPTRGWFETPDKPYVCSAGSTSLFYGNRARAKDRIGHLLYRGRYGLVLVDSPYRGGAGGQPAFGYPAWSTITNCPGEDWRAVAVHEIGHAFGLGDEYVQDSLANHPLSGELNIYDPGQGLPAPWRASAGWDRLVPISEQGSIPDDHDVVSYFHGAHYREDLCRPSLNCLMRTTTPIPSLGTHAFCKICEGVLADALT